MLLLNSLRGMIRRATASPKAPRRWPGRGRPNRRLVVEELEARTLLSVVYTAVAAGDPTSTGAILWTRALDPANPGNLPLAAQVSTDPTFGTIARTFTGSTDVARDNILKIDATGLQSGTPYYYRFTAGNGQSSRVGTFKTAPAVTASAPLHFGFSGDADGRWRPYPSAVGIPAQNYDFFVYLGDTLYETATLVSPATADPFANPTQALADYRRKYREQLQPVNPGGLSGLNNFFAAQANYTLLDNHELGNLQFASGGAPAGTPPGAGVDATNPEFDVNTTGTFMNRTPGFQGVLLQAYNDFQPIRERTVSAPNDPRSDGTQQLYFAQQWGRNAIFFNLDDRSYRDIQLQGTGATGPRADNPGRTMLGRTQLEWFKQSLLDAQANGITWKFVAVSSPIDHNGNDGNAVWRGGYRAERNELLKFIADNHVEHVVFLTTHNHQVRINELTYQADPSDPASLVRVPGAFQILAGPIAASGPDGITDHSFSNIKSRADDLAAGQIAQGIDPIGLDPRFPGLFNVFRESDPDADSLRQPVDFFSPDTFNYAGLELSADGKTLTVRIFGINSYAANTFPEPGALDAERLILSFQIVAPPSLESVLINDGAPQRSRVTSLTVTFSGVVTLDPGAFELLRQGGGLVGLNVARSAVDGRTVAVLTFTGADIVGGSLADGNYTLTIRGDRIHDLLDQELDGDGDGLAGGNRLDHFFRLFGDSDGDRDVDAWDLFRFLGTLGRRAGQTGFLDYFDFDGDNDVDLIDSLAFFRRIGTYLRP